MDCEKLDAMAIDLVDPDTGDDGVVGLSPRALREAEEHLAGCSRCSAVIERLRSGMRAAGELGLEDPSSLLEARIFAAAGAVAPDVSVPRRISRAVSTLGSWAMRPQVAMAAVLLVMVGTSIVLLRGGNAPSARNTKVTEEGTPIATLEPQSTSTPEGQGAPAVIGGEKKKNEPAAPREMPKPDQKPQALDDLAKSGDFESADKNVAAAEKSKAKDEAPAKGLKEDDLATVAGTKKPVATAPPPPAAMPAPASPPADFGGTSDGKLESKKTGGAGPAPTTAAPGGGMAASSYDDAMTAYKESRWAAAAKGFDASAAAGDKVSTSLLYSARSYRASGSCAQALPRYQKLVSGYASSAEAPHGAIEGGQCAKALSDFTTARALFEKAKTYAVTQKQAEAELAALDKPPQTNAPAKAKAAKPSTAVDSAY